MEDPLSREIEELRVLMGSSRDPDGRVFAQLGDALRRAGRLDDAADVLEQGLESHPHYTPGHLTLGWVELERGDLGAARTRFGRTLDLDPDNPFGLLGLGRLLELGGDPAGTEMVERALELHPGAESFAPSVPEALRELEDLPFRALEELAPVLSRAGDLAERPFLSLEDLAPEPKVPPLSALPFMTLWDLRPEDDSVSGEAVEAAGRAADAAPPEVVEQEDFGTEDSPGDPGELTRSAFPEPGPAEAPGAADVAHPVGPGPRSDLPSPGADQAPTVEDAAAVDDAESPELHGAEAPPDAREPDDAWEPEDAGEMEDAAALEDVGEPDEDVAELDEDVAELGGDAIPVTRTMAELLVRQGLLDRAVEMFRELCQRHPGEGELAARLEEVEAMGSRLGPTPDVGARTLPPSPTPEPVHEATMDAADDEAAVHPSLEVPEPDPEAPSPYAWDEEGEEVAEPTTPDASVGAYFGRLLAWTPGNPAREADEATSPESQRGPDSESS